MRKLGNREVSEPQSIAKGDCVVRTIILGGLYAETNPNFPENARSFMRNAGLRGLSPRWRTEAENP